MRTLPALLALGLGGAAASAALASTPDLAGAASPAATLAALLPADTPLAAPRYDVRGVFDPGLGGIIAFAIKVPHGWLLQQSFTRQWDRALPSNKIFLSLTAPDKQQAITLLPEVLYQYSNSPEAQRVAAFMAQGGHPDPSRLAPMLPVDYLKRVVLPLLNQQPATRLRVTAEHGDPPKTTTQNVQQATGYVEGVLPSGRKVHLESEVNVLTMNLNGYTSNTWSVTTSIVESTTDLAATVATAKAIGKSAVPNPAWQRQDNALKERGTQANIRQSQADMQQIQADNAANQARIMQRFHQNVANQQAQRSAINGAFQRRMQANSQVANAYADFMGDKTLYQNPNTGERYQVQGSLGHVYQDQQGTVLNTNQPLSGSHVDWQELQQVELKNY